MAVNKVIYYGEVLVDMSTVTVKPETLGKGETALDASGEMITGTAEIGGEDVTAETNTYTDLLTDLEAAVEALPDAGSGGSGGSVETCTVVINYPVNLFSVGYTACIDGEVTTMYESLNGHKSSTINNVVCNSFLMVRSSSVYSPTPTITGGGEMITTGLYTVIGYKVTDIAGGTMTVDMYDDD